MNRTKNTETHNILAVTPNGNKRLALNYWVQTIYPAPPAAAAALVQHWTFRWFVSACKHHSSPAASCAAILGEQCEAQDWTPAHIHFMSISQSSQTGRSTWSDKYTAVLRVVSLLSIPDKVAVKLSWVGFNIPLTQWPCWHISGSIHPGNFLTSAKQPAFSIKHLAGTDKTRQLHNQE